MSWSDWTAFQTHDRWPEPGLLARVGDCLTEHAPSGAYVEDWRLQPCEDGPLIGLRLIEERDPGAGVVRHRGGGLVVCGHNAALVLGRPEPLPVTGTIADVVRAHVHDRQLMRAVFACEASYGTRAGDGAFTVVASTNPLREGRALLDLGGFSYDEHQGLVFQRTHEEGAPVERTFAVDTIEAGVAFPLATEATSEGQRWLEREGPTLLARAR
jgi:hypothetical protein